MAYTNAIFYLDYETTGNGDAVRATLSGVVFSNPSGTTVLGTKVGHGLVTGAVVTVSGCTQAYANTVWKITRVNDDTFTVDTALWASWNGADVTGDVVPFGGQSWADAWKTITSGATAARIAPGDIIRIAKSPDPVPLAGTTATWENCQTGGGFPATKAVSATADNGAGLIRVTTAATHGYSTNDIVQLIAVGGTLEANGAWKITVISTTQFDLQGSAYVNAWTSGGTAQKINSKAVVLTTAETQDITRCETDWSVTGFHGTSAAKLTTDAKEGGACVKIVNDAAPAADQVQAFFATGTIPAATIGDYQKISFWIKNEVAILANQLELNLCSNADGTGEIDVFPIPAIPSTGQWVCLTIARNGGTNLGNNGASDVLSINLSLGSNATPYTASKYVYLDNIIATKTAGLNLQSLISKNSLAQGGTEGWYGIQSINGKIVLLDNYASAKSNEGRGYSTQGTSPETVNTYIRETIKTVMTTSTTAVGSFQDSGTLAGGYIEYQGGYNTADSSQDGETFFDGLNGYGVGFDINSKSFIKINRCSFCRYYVGMQLAGSSSHHLYIDNLLSSSNCNNPISMGYSGDSIINYIGSMNNNNSYCNLGFNINIGQIREINNNNGHGLYIENNGNIINALTNVMNNNGYGINFTSGSGGTVIRNGSTKNNSSGGVTVSYGADKVYLNKFIINETNEVGGLTNYSNVRALSRNHDNQVDNHWVFTDGGTINSLANDRAGGAGLKWKYIITSSKRDTTYPLNMVLMEIPVNANSIVTITAYCKKDSNNVGAKLCCRGGQLAGLATDVFSNVKADDTDWELLTLTLNQPTESGVLEIEGWAYYIAGNSNVYFADVEVSQA